MPQQRTATQPPYRYKATRRRIKLLMILLVCYITWAGVTFWEQAGKVNAKVSDLSVLDKKLHNVEQQNIKYKQDILRLNDNEYIEQRARKDFQMSRPGEKLFITPGVEE